MSRDVRLLTFTSLYPSTARPRHGIFVEARLQRLLAQGGIGACVVAPIPWFPFRGDLWGEYGRMARTPDFENRKSVAVKYPRYLMVPKIGMSMQPLAMARAGYRTAVQIMRQGTEFDVIDAHYLYPDGVAAALLAGWLRRPYVLTARGTDVNVIAQMPAPRARILRAVEGSAGVIAVSSALKASLVGLGVAADRVTVLRNGVDADLFSPVDRTVARRALGLPTDVAGVIASVGNLVPAKRHDLVLAATAGLPGVLCLIVGRGNERTSLEQQARRLGIEQRVHFFEEMDQERLRYVYSAANALVLASEREGWPNVVLESAACGTPVVAFNIGGVPEILVDPMVGTIIKGRHAPEPLVSAISQVIECAREPAAVRAAAVRFSWDPVLAAQIALYQRALAANGYADRGTLAQGARV
jgi:glycosyltransferase involved in cell wall biosynthesis